MLRASILPVAFYGIELILAPRYQLESLRTQIANAILGHACQSGSSALLLHLLPGLHDPMIQALIQAVKQATLFLQQASEPDRTLFCAILSKHSGNFKVYGPASVLRESLLRVGLQCNAVGDILGSDIGIANLLTSSANDIIALIQWEWQQQFLPTQTERKHIGRMLPIDQQGTIRLLSEFNDAQRLLLLREISGSFQTRHQQQQWDTAEQGICPWCSQSADTREHRTFHCAAFAACRLPYQQTLAQLAEDVSFLANLPTLRVHGETWWIHFLQQQMPQPSLDLSVQQQIQYLYGDGTPTFFTDGSCAHPDHPIRFASFAVVVDLSVTHCRKAQAVQAFRQHNLPVSDLVPVTSARVAGRQTVNRAELMAVTWVYEHFPELRL